MGNFDRGNRKSSGGFGRGFGNDRSSGGDRKFGGGKSFGDRREGGRPTMHEATCSDCGSRCQLPFRPSGDRPVFCSKCFDKQGGGSTASRPSRFSEDRHERPRFESREDREMHDATCGKCGNDCQVPFRPTAGKPVFCSNCFEKGGNGGSKDSGELMDMIKKLNYKVDMLVKMLTPKTSVEEEEKSGAFDEEIVLDEVVKEKKERKPRSAKKTAGKKK